MLIDVSLCLWLAYSVFTVQGRCSVRNFEGEGVALRYYVYQRRNGDEIIPD